ncbi:hypothetical protein Celaphus_00017292, partial [Cervus elaphus hippelaphus]
MLPIAWLSSRECSGSSSNTASVLAGKRSSGFEQENQRLIGEMNSLFDEVRHPHVAFGPNVATPAPSPSTP